MSRAPGESVVHVAVADHDRARGRLLEAGDHPQRGRLAAAGRADQHHQLAVARSSGRARRRRPPRRGTPWSRRRSATSRHGYPLTPMAAIERTNQRWATMKTISIGASAITLPGHQQRPLGLVRALEGREPELHRVVVGRRDHDQRPQEVVPRPQERDDPRASRAPGRDSGSTIRNSTPSRLQPSIRAASSSSIGQRAEELAQQEDAERRHQVGQRSARPGCRPGPGAGRSGRSGSSPPGTAPSASPGARRRARRGRRSAAARRRSRPGCRTPGCRARPRR